MNASRLVAVVATLDTKAAEAAFVRRWLADRGFDARLVDVGVRPAPGGVLGPGDVPSQAVAEAAGLAPGTPEGLRRDQLMAAIASGAARILLAWAEAGRLAGVIGLGGNQGTAVACSAMRALPAGLPKVMVSTVASGNIRPYIGASDIAMVFSLADLLGGPNRITRGVLSRAAAMLAGMVLADGGAWADACATDAGSPPAGVGPASAAPVEEARPAVALTTLGNTQEAATRIMAGLREAGLEPVPFHASGAGGSAMERLVEAGAFAGVVDLTPHELLGELFPEDIYAPVSVQRLTAAGRRALPLVVAPGGLDYFVFGGPQTVPERWRGRPTHYHNPYNTNVRASADELARAGAVLAERLRASRGPAAFLFPRRGWSHIGREGGPLWDAAANAALRDAVASGLTGSHVLYQEVDAALNDPAFGDEVLRVYLACAAAPAASGEGGNRHGD